MVRRKTTRAGLAPQRIGKRSLHQQLNSSVTFSGSVLTWYCFGRQKGRHDCKARGLASKTWLSGRTAMDRLESLVEGIQSGLNHCSDFRSYCDSCCWGEPSMLDFPHRNSAPTRISKKVYVDAVGVLTVKTRRGERCLPRW
jgi:hypothetical protein